MSATTERVLAVCRPDNESATETTLQSATGELPVTTVTSTPDAEAELDAGGVVCVVSFIEIPDALGNEWLSGVDLFRTVQQREERVPYVLISETGNEDLVVEALDAGVSNLIRPWPGDRPESDLRETVEQIVSRRRLYSTVEAATEGDLDTRMAVEDLRGDYREIATRINRMIDSIQSDVERREAVARDVESSVSDLRTRSEEVADSSEQIRETTESMTGSVDEVTSEVTTLSATVEEVASTADHVAQTSENALDAAEEGHASADRAIDAMETIDGAAGEVTTDVQSLRSRVDEIDEVVELINDIADQTNMLALNANIEAARAGEAGAGFAVVADEVKNLAEEAQSHADTIEGMIDGIQQDTETTVESLNHVTEEIQVGIERVTVTMEALNEIVDTVEEASNGINEVADATDDQAASAEEVAAMMDDVSDLAADVSEEIGAIAAANSRQVEGMREIEASVTRLLDE